MANRLMTLEEASRSIVEITERHAKTVDEKDRAAFMRAAYEWLHGALANSKLPTGDGSAER